MKKKKRWKGRLLAGVLAASLVFQNLSVASLAAGHDAQGSTADETEVMMTDTDVPETVETEADETCTPVTGTTETEADSLTPESGTNTEEPPEEKSDGTGTTESETPETETVSEPETAGMLAEELTEEETGSTEENTAELPEASSEADNEAAEKDVQFFSVEDAEGVFQAGSFKVPDRDVSGISTLSTEEDWKKWDAYIYEQLKARNAEINVKDFQLPNDKVSDWYFGVINEHPDLYFVVTGYSGSSSGGVVISITPQYVDGAYDDNKFMAETARALSVITDEMSDMEKAVALHDYIVLNCEYDYDRLENGTMPKISYSAYGVLVERTAVCQGYALAYKYLLQKAGIECCYVSSEKMNHAWNMVKLDGTYYHVDTTWDDPTRDLIGRVCHSHMFVSDDAFGKKRGGSSQYHYGWTVSYQGEVAEISAADTTYDGYFWVDVKSPLVLEDGRYYYTAWDENKNNGYGSACIVSSSTDGKAAETVYDIGSWNNWENANSFWQGSYSGLFLIGSRLYFNTPEAIYSVELDGSDKREEFKADTSNGYIYGSAYCQGEVRYALHQSPNLTAKEEILIAHLSGGLPAQKLSVPVFSPEQGKVAKGTQVTITSVDKDVTIYYTTDGTEPDTGSSVYKEPVMIEKDTTIKAVAVKDGYENSEVVSAVYQVDDGVWTGASGTVNDISWAIDQDGNLTVTGTGDYSEGDINSTSPPWLEYKDHIRTAKVSISDITFLNSMFENCTELTKVDLSGLDTRKVQNTACMFWGCSKLTALDVSNFKTDNVTSMMNMFAECRSLTSLDLSGFETGNVTDMSEMFLFCNSLTSLDVSSFDTGKVKDVRHMFGGCSSLTSLDVSSFDMQNVEKYDHMLYMCEKLSYIRTPRYCASGVALPVSEFDTDHWYTEDGTECTELPKGLAYSVALHKNGYPGDGNSDLKKSAFISGITMDDKVYDGTAVSYSGKAVISDSDGKEITEDVPVSYAYTGILADGSAYQPESGTQAPSQAGKYTLTVATDENSVYQGSKTYPFTIRQRELTVTADSFIIHTGGAMPDLTCTADGFLEGESFIQEPVLECNAEDTSVQGTYDIIPSGGDAGMNYHVNYVNGLLKIEEAVTYTVTFDMQQHGAQTAAVTVIGGDKVAKPGDPVAQGYIFGGWYREAGCITAWNFDTDTVTSDLTLYAKWTVQSIIIDDVTDDDIYPERTDLETVSGAIAAIKNKVYDGTPYTPTVKVTVRKGTKKITLTAGTDYRVRYESCTNAGTGKVIVSGNGAYTGTITREFTITPKPVNKLKVVTGSTAVGSDPANIPVYIYDGTRLLKNGTDYEFPVDESLTQKKTSSAKVTIMGKGNYKGTVKAKFAVCEGDASKMITPDAVRLAYASTPYTGKAINNNDPIVKLGGAVLVKNKQYKVSYQNNKNAGTAFVIITGKGGYTGKVVKTFEITAVKGTKLSIKDIPTKTYNAKLQKPSLTVKAGNKKLSLNKDYTVSYAGNLHAGKATVTVAGKGNYAGTNAKTTFVIKPQKIAKASVKGNMVDGLTLVYGKRNLIENTDYKLSYDEASRKKNKIKVTISGLGDFANSTVTKTVKTGAGTPGAAVSPVPSKNEGKHDYTSWFRPVTSYLAANADGTLMRVEYIESKVWVETYKPDGTCITQKQIKMELPVFGGFYAGKNHYFLAYGKENPEEDDKAEVVRVVKYDKNWKRQGAASLYGANTKQPFKFGSLRMTENNGMLYVRTCHVMYKSSDGANHQANLTFSIRESDMKITDQVSGVMGIGNGYVSHSFNQFINTDGSVLMAVDHGDAYPRSVALIKYSDEAGNEKFTNGRCSYVHVLLIQGKTGANKTGVSVGGFEISEGAYLVAGNSVPQDNAETYNASGVRNIFVTSTRKENFTSEGTKLRWITSYTDGDSVNVSTPQLVKVASNEFLLLWTEADQVRYVLLDGDGQPTTGIYSMNGKLSDCQPVLAGDCVVWYYTSNGKPKFCRLNLSEIRNS